MYKWLKEIFTVAKLCLYNMPSPRQYKLVKDFLSQDMRQKFGREQIIRSVSVTSSGNYENAGSHLNKKDFVFEVTKSPRAPEYAVHYVKTRTDGIKLVGEFVMTISYTRFCFMILTGAKTFLC